MKRFIAALFFIITFIYPVFAMTFDTLPGYQDEGMKLYIRGTGKLQEGDYAGAITDLRRAVKLRPDIAEAFHNLGFAFERTGNLKSAARAYERALRLKPNYPSALNNLGYLLASTNTDVQKAIILCRKAVELQPNSASFRDSLGWAFYKANDINNAILNFKAALKLNPSFFKSYFNLGLIAFKQKHYRKAAKYFKKTLQFQPNFIKAYVPLADCYEKLNNKNKALYIYQQALAKMPDNNPIKKHLQRKVRALSKESKSYYFKSVKKLQGSSKLQAFMRKKSKFSRLNAYASANPLGSTGNFTPVSVTTANTTIAPHYETQTVKLPSYSSLPTYEPDFSNTDSYTQVSRYKRVKRATTTEDWQSSYVKPTVIRRPQLTVKQERELDRKYSLAKSYLDRGLTQDAKRELQQIINLAPANSMVNRQARNMLLKVQKIIEQKQIALAQTHRDMGKDFFRSGQYDMAEEEFKKALKLDPDSAETHKDLALLNYNLGRYKQAYEESKKAIALDRTLKEAYVVLGSLYAKKGRTKDALRTLKRVKEVSTNRDAVDELADKMIASLSGDF